MQFYFPTVAEVSSSIGGSNPGFLFGCFSQLFVSICPLAVIALYLSMSSSLSIKERVETAKKGCIVAWGVLITTAIVGPKFLESIGVLMDSFKMAGGLFLLIIGFDMLRSSDPESDVSSEEAASINSSKKRKKGDIAITPLGVPLIAGPGSITVVLASRAEANGVFDFFSCLIAISAVCVAMYWCLAITSKGTKWLTPVILKLSFRLSGLFLVAIGVQFLMDGLKASNFFQKPCVISAILGF